MDRVQKEKIPFENIRMLARLMKSPLGVQSADNLKREYDLHKKRVKFMQKFDERGKPKPRVSKVFAKTFQAPPADASTSPRFGASPEMILQNTPLGV